MRRENPKAADVIAYVERLWGSDCVRCGVPLIGHDAVLALMLGFSDAPPCFACLAVQHGQRRGEFVEASARRVRRLACYRAGWRHSDERLATEGPWPEERIPSRLRMDSDEDPDDEAELDDASAVSDEPLDALIDDVVDLERWDAGDRGCGELALELKLRVRRLAPGARLLLTTTDPGARADLPAWCRLTGNRLVAAAPPRFLIECRPKDDRPPPT